VEKETQKNGNVYAQRCFPGQMGGRTGFQTERGMASGKKKGKASCLPIGEGGGGRSGR